MTENKMSGLEMKGMKKMERKEKERERERERREGERQRKGEKENGERERKVDLSPPERAVPPSYNEERYNGPKVLFNTRVSAFHQVLTPSHTAGGWRSHQVTHHFLR